MHNPEEMIGKNMKANTRLTPVSFPQILHICGDKHLGEHPEKVLQPVQI
jgi:hypothetical protein